MCDVLSRQFLKIARITENKKKGNYIGLSLHTQAMLFLLRSGRDKQFIMYALTTVKTFSKLQNSGLTLTTVALNAMLVLRGKS